MLFVHEAFQFECSEINVFTLQVLKQPHAYRESPIRMFKTITFVLLVHILFFNAALHYWVIT